MRALFRFRRAGIPCPRASRGPTARSPPNPPFNKGPEPIQESAPAAQLPHIDRPPRRGRGALLVLGSLRSTSRLLAAGPRP